MHESRSVCVSVHVSGMPVCPHVSVCVLCDLCMLCVLGVGVCKGRTFWKVAPWVDLRTRSPDSSS